MQLPIRPIASLLSALCLGATLLGQQAIRVSDTGAQVRNQTTPEGVRSAVSRDGGDSWIDLPAPRNRLTWRSRSFDPLEGDAAVPANLRANEANELFYVQFVTDIVPEYRTAMERLGARSVRYYPHEAFVVRIGRDRIDAVREQPFVRAVMELETAHKLDTVLQEGLLDGTLPTARYNLVLVDKRRDAEELERRVQEIGGMLEAPADGGLLISATLTPVQLRQVALENTVLWIDYWTEPEFDVDNARIQGGVNYVESAANIDGRGMRGGINEAIADDHPEFAAIAPWRTAPLLWPKASTNTFGTHGTNTAGEIYAQGLAGGVKGILPLGTLIESNSVSSGRYSMANSFRDPAKLFKVGFMTQSWGGGRTTQYTSTSAFLDDILFDFPQLWATNSQSNAGNQNSRPEAWAKNVCGIGGFYHRNNANPDDDCWCNSGSTGPAEDGRVGVSFASYYDSIRTTNPSGYTNSFGGTSGATPIVNGLGGAAIQMFTDGLLGYPGVDWDDRFGNEPFLTTTRVMLTLCTRQVSFTGSNRASRVQQGWGMPNLQDLYDNRDNILLLNEEDVLLQGESRDYWVWVKPGTGEFRASMHYLEDSAAPSAIPTRHNSLDLSVFDYNGNTWWGNGNGILEGPWSTPGGGPNDIDIHENVFIQNPASGPYRVRVTAAVLRDDNHMETAGMDADFALGIRGIGGGRDRSGITLDMVSDSPGQFDVTVGNLPAAGWVRGITMFSKTTDRHLSLGSAFGVELDSLSTSIIKWPVAEGRVFAFTNSTNPAVYPNATYSFDPSVAAQVAGKTLDAVIVLFDASGQIVDVSNAARVTVM